MVALLWHGLPTMPHPRCQEGSAQKNLEGVNAFQELQILHPLGEGDSGVLILSVKPKPKHEKNWMKGIPMIRPGFLAILALITLGDGSRGQEPSTRAVAA